MKNFTKKSNSEKITECYLNLINGMISNGKTKELEEVIYFYTDYKKLNRKSNTLN